MVRGRAADAGVFSGLRRERVEVRPVDTAIGVRAGQIMGAARVGSGHAVDAFIVSVGVLDGGAVVATTDARDLERLTAHAVNVIVASIQP